MFAVGISFFSWWHVYMQRVGSELKQTFENGLQSSCVCKAYLIGFIQEFALCLWFSLHLMV